MNKRAVLLLLAASLFAAPARAQTLRDILADYDRLTAEQDPVSAGQRGDLAAAARWPDDSPAAIADQTRRMQAIAAKLRALPPLAGQDALNARLLLWRLDIARDGRRFDEERIPFTSDEGFFTTPLDTASSTVLHTPAQARAWIARLHALPAYFATETANLQRGLATGFTQPRQTAIAAAHTVQAMAATPAEQDPLLAPLDTLPASLGDLRATLHAQAADVIRTEVKPAEAALAAFLTLTYVPGARSTLGASALPDGRAYYAWRVRHETTTSLTPDQVFAIGTAEVARIRGAMQAEIGASGFHGSFAQFQNFLRHDRQFVASSPEDLLARASRLAKMVDDKLPQFFGRLPRLPYGVRPVPALIADGYTSARYNPGSPEQGVAGGLMINTSHLDQRPLYELPALVAHEGAPGHHIQIALAQELADVPQFRRADDLTAFVEGWALYAEQLGRDIGLYRTPYERFGLLSMEMWRACRLVIDVGLHWKGFTRDQALACLRDNTALAEHNIETEVDRYIAWPGQALGYKVGELAMLDLRHQAEASLGAAFDLRAFHDWLLDEGAMPLDVLRERLPVFLQEGGK